MVEVVIMAIKSIVKNKVGLGIATAIILGITVSCKKQETVIDKSRGFKPEKIEIEYKMEFPDTLYTHQEYNGIVKYKSVLDTITTEFGNKEKYRYVLLFLTTTNHPYHDPKQLKHAIRDTFGAINNREIPFSKIKFNTTGVFYIEGIINDYVLIDTDKKNKEGVELAREIENEKWITHKVVVIDKPK
jgi:hypothetical protein